MSPNPGSNPSLAKGETELEHKEKNSKLRKVVAASMAGTVVEWYEFFIYGTAAALVFPAVFFPGETARTGLIYAFSTYAIGFAARPLGGLVFGHYGDKFGRKKLLQLSIVLVGISTFLMGCLPTYGAVGVLAPILLVVLRFAQGFAVGGVHVSLDTVEPEPTLTADGAWWHPVAVTNPHLRVSDAPLPLATVFDVIADVLAVQAAGQAAGRTVFRCT